MSITKRTHCCLLRKSPTHMNEKRACNGNRKAQEDGRGVILFYHGFHRQRRDPHTHRFSVSIEEFSRHLDFLANRYELVGLSELLHRISGRSSSVRSSVTLSFDDALMGFHQLAVPLLFQRGLPYVVSVPVGLLGRGRPIWSMELDLVILHCQRQFISFKLGSRQVSVVLRDRKQRLEILTRLRARLFTMRQQQRRKTMQSLKENLTAEQQRQLLARHHDLQVMGRAELRSLLKGGAEIALHGSHHIPLHGGESSATFREEICDARRELEELAGSAVDYFCLPYGVDSEPARKACAAEGFSAILTTEEAGICEGTTLPYLPRVSGERSLESLQAASGRAWAAFPSPRNKGFQLLKTPRRVLRNARILVRGF